MATDTNVSSTPAVSPDSGTPPAAATPAAPAPQSATPAAPPSGATSTPSAGPEGWVPSYRLRETREAALRESQTQWASKEAELRAEIQRTQEQIRALTGVATPQNPEVSAVRQQFGNLYPGLAKLEERATQLEQLLERAGDLESQNDHYWQSYGRQTMDRLFTHASESLGGPLTDEGKRLLHASFVGFVQSSPEMSERYAQDPSIVEDFWKAYSSTFIDPVRRTAAAGVQARAAGLPAMPADTPGGAPQATPAPKLNGLDERAAAAWASYNATAKPQR